MQSRQEFYLRNFIRYSGLAFGTGYLLLFIGAIAVVGELVARALPYTGTAISLAGIPPSIILAGIFIFIAVLCGIAFGASVIKDSNWRRSDKTTKCISSSVTTFSLMILFSGLALISVILSVPSYSSGSSLLPFLSVVPSVWTPTICSIIGAVLLLLGYRVFASEHAEPKLIGGILMIVSVVLIYIVALSPLRDAWGLLGSLGGLSGIVPYSSGITLPPLPGPLSGELNIETVSMIVASVCAVLYTFQSLRAGKGAHGLRLILSIAGIAFGAGLLYFNFSMISLISNAVGYISQYMVTIWIIFIGLLILGISGIIVLITGIMSLVVSIKGLQATSQVFPPSPPPPPP